MKNLQALQSIFQNYLLDKDTQMQSHISGTDEQFTQKRLDIYQTGYRLRLWEALEDDFPTLKVLSGEDLFEDICRDYLDRHPSSHFSIRYFAQYLIAFLSTHQPYREQPALSEMAQFEWALCYALDAKDKAVFTLEALQTTPQEDWPTMAFALHPSVQLHEVNHNILDLWVANNREASLPGIALFEEKQLVTVWRNGLEAFYSNHTKEEAIMIKALEAGQNFAQICEALCEYLPEEEVPQFALNTLVQLIQDGLISF